MVILIEETYSIFVEGGGIILGDMLIEETHYTREYGTRAHSYIILPDGDHNVQGDMLIEETHQSSYEGVQ